MLLIKLCVVVLAVTASAASALDANVIAKAVIHTVKKHKAEPRLLLVADPAAPVVDTYDNKQNKAGPLIAAIENVLEKHVATPVTYGSGNVGPSVKYLKYVDIAIVSLGALTDSGKIVRTVQALQQLDGVKSVEADQFTVPVHKVKPEDRTVSGHAPSTFEETPWPNDALAYTLWALDEMKAYDAWEIFTGGPIKVCIISSGAQFNHDDLTTNMYINEEEANGDDGVDDDGNGYVDDIRGWNAIDNSLDAEDDHGFGTHVAGIIGAAGNNEIGVVGVNWRPQIVACRYMDKYEYGLIAAVVECIDYSIAIGCRVSSHGYGLSSAVDSVSAAIDKAAEYGQLCIASAGSSGENLNVKPVFPASFKKINVISVTSLRKGGEGLNEDSNYSPDVVHLAAPGEDILSTHLDGFYSYNSGSSMAAPQVAGVAALMMSFNPELTFTRIKEILMETSVGFTGSDISVMWGKIDLLEAMKAVQYSIVALHYITVPGDYTCMQGCAQHNLTCNDQKTQLMDIDIDVCAEGLASSGFGKNRPILVGAQTDTNLAPAGCYIDDENVVRLNQNTFGLQLGCHGGIVKNPPVQNVCACGD